MSLAQRLRLTLKVLVKVFRRPILAAILLVWLLNLRAIVALGQGLDRLFCVRAVNTPLRAPVVIVGNPRSGTTFLHRFLSNSGLFAGSQLYRMVFPSLVLQRVLTPILPILEVLSPARFHNTPAHSTSLGAEETDDVLALLRFVDGTFLYGFFLAWLDKDWLPGIDPKAAGTLQRDLDWMDRGWRVSVAAQGGRPLIKTFAQAADLSVLMERYPDARVLYLVRDPARAIPSALSLITGVLGRAVGLERVSERRKRRHHQRVAEALAELYRRFHDDYTQGRLDRERILVVPFDGMMADFEGQMQRILDFTSLQADPELARKIAATAESQRAYRSPHSYQASRFGLDEQQLRRDCAFVYDTFLPSQEAT